MRQDVKQFINECPNCQFMQAAKLAITKRAQIQPYNMATGKPMDRINIDTIGPFNEDDDGNKYIMKAIVTDPLYRLWVLEALTEVHGRGQLSPFITLLFIGSWGEAACHIPGGFLSSSPWVERLAIPKIDRFSSTEWISQC